MSDTSDDYERFIESLVQNLNGMGRQISQVGCGRHNTIQGVSEQYHQIDVSFVDSSCGAPTLVIIECKRLNSVVNLSYVKVLKATIDDIQQHKATPGIVKGIIVTTKGYRKGARRFAAFYGIRIEQVPHGPNYTFRYENIIQAGITQTVNFDVSVAAEIDRPCEICGKSFRVVLNENVCPACKAAAGG